MFCPSESVRTPFHCVLLPLSLYSIIIVTTAIIHLTSSYCREREREREREKERERTREKERGSTILFLLTERRTKAIETFLILLPFLPSLWETDRDIHSVERERICQVLKGEITQIGFRA